jgi:hypothetical protein
VTAAGRVRDTVMRTAQKLCSQIMGQRLGELDQVAHVGGAVIDAPDVERQRLTEWPMVIVSRGNRSNRPPIIRRSAWVAVSTVQANPAKRSRRTSSEPSAPGSPHNR